MSATNLSRLKTAVIIINIVAASMALANIAALSTRVVEVDALDDSMIWSLDILERRIIIQADINIKNNAIYDIRDIYIDATLRLEDGTTILEYKRNGMVVPSISNQPISIMVSISLTDNDVRRMVALLLADDLFILHMRITATYLWGFGDFHMNQNFELKWTAPLKRAMLDYMNREGTGSLMEGARAAMYSGDIRDFFDKMGAPEVDLALKAAGIAASIIDTTIGNDTAHICMLLEHNSEIYEIKITIPTMDHASTTISFMEVDADG